MGSEMYFYALLQKVAWAAEVIKLGYSVMWTVGVGKCTLMGRGHHQAGVLSHVDGGLRDVSMGVGGSTNLLILCFLFGCRTWTSRTLPTL